MQIYPDSRPQIPWLVLTSDTTDGPTRNYFEEKKFFGLDESQVHLILTLKGHEGIRKPMYNWGMDLGMAYVQYIYVRSKYMCTNLYIAGYVVKVCMNMCGSMVQQFFHCVTQDLK